MKEMHNDIYLEALLANFPGFVFFKNLQGEYIKSNEAYAVKLGLKSTDEIVGKQDSDFFAPDDVTRIAEFEENLSQSGERAEVNEMIKWPDGTTSWVKIMRRPFYDSKGDMIGWCGMTVCHAEQSESDIELQEKTSILNAITERMPVVIYKYRVDTGVNILLGKAKLKASFKNSKMVKFSIADGLSTLVDKISEERDKLGYLHFTSTQGDRSFENFVFKGEYSDDEYIGLALDVTDSKQAKQKIKKNAKELEKINRELNQFAYIISHDLKAPLRAITNLSEWIEEDMEDTENEEVIDNLRLLRSRVSRMENLINGILAYSRVSRSKIEYEEVKVEEVVNDVLDSLMVPKKFDVIIAQELPVITFPKINLEQIFSNLISNAVKYHDKEQGRIELGYKEEQEFHSFWVKDDGPGIAPEYHEKIFVIFQTLHARDSIESTGIGLTIVKKILEDKGGEINIKSDKGKGTCFIFRIPKSFNS